MIEDDVLKLLRQVRTLDRAPLQIVAATEDELASFERTHSLTLPRELLEWFRHSNGASVNPGGLYSLSSPPDQPSLDWYLTSYPNWKANQWFPIASDGCGDLYILTAKVVVPATGTHPVCFLDQSDFTKPQYAVATGVWKFLYQLLQTEILRDQGKDAHWPFNKDAVLAVDPALVECSPIPLPWEIDEGEGVGP